MKIPEEILDWLLSGDPSIQYKVKRDLLDSDDGMLQKKITTEGWGSTYLNARKPDGHWGRAFYQPKWTSTHYTLLDLKNLSLPQDNKTVKESLEIIMRNVKGIDGGINPSKSICSSDLCINGMFLNYASYFGTDEKELKSVVDLIIRLQMKDGGFNCRINRSGAKHSSLHTTISVLEGIHEFKKQNYSYKIKELAEIENEAIEFMLCHKLFKSDRTGEIISNKMTMLSYPCRWQYDILRALEYLQEASVPYDSRMKDALDILMAKRRKDGRWPVQAKHPGKTHVEMEITGQESRWNTLRALKVLRCYT